MREEENPVLPITVPQRKYFIKNKEKKHIEKQFCRVGGMETKIQKKVL